MSKEAMIERRRVSPPVLCAPIFIAGLALAGWGGWQVFWENPAEKDRIVDQTPQCSGLSLSWNQVNQIGQTHIKDTSFTVEDLARDPSARMLTDCYRFARKAIEDHKLGPDGIRTQTSLLGSEVGAIAAAASAIVGWARRND